MLKISRGLLIAAWLVLVGFLLFAFFSGIQGVPVQ